MLGDRTDEDEEVLKTKTSTVAVTALVQIPLEELGSSRKAKKPHKHISLGLFRKQQVSGEELINLTFFTFSRVSVHLVTMLLINFILGQKCQKICNHNHIHFKGFSINRVLTLYISIFN